MLSWHCESLMGIISYPRCNRMNVPLSPSPRLCIFPFSSYSSLSRCSSAFHSDFFSWYLPASCFSAHCTGSRNHSPQQCKAGTSSATTDFRLASNVAASIASATTHATARRSATTTTKQMTVPSSTTHCGRARKESGLPQFHCHRQPRLARMIEVGVRRMAKCPGRDEVMLTPLAAQGALGGYRTRSRR